MDKLKRIDATIILRVNSCCSFQGVGMPELEDCERELFSMFNSALKQNQESLEINAGHLHRRVFGVGPDWVTFCWAAMQG